MIKKLKPIERNKNPIEARVKIGHVHLKTANVERVYDFYVGILGFDVVARMPGALFVSAGGYHHHLAFNTWESEGGVPPAHGTTGLYHVAILYPSKDSFVDAISRLKKAKWPIDGLNDHGTHQAIYLKDPDNNGLELYWDRPENLWPVDSEGHLSFERNQEAAAELLKLVQNT